ncbi:TonB-dependent siderophore receptor [Pseudorhodoferax sp. LjRoot39]|uniref:TonB-dependent siderophore receptor n=1 Tax=Pseudorhodoferax sp. LjRoot39 TaxID=3342328 RepID=UPI003ECEF573
MPRSPLRPAPLALALALVFAAPLHAQDAAAPVAIRIAALPLGEALNDWARQTRIQLFVQPDATAGKTAPAVAGSLSPSAALDRLLAGSGLYGRFEGHAVTIERVAAGGGAALAPVTVTATAERSPTTELTGSYTARALSIGKMEQSIRETPQSVTVVTRQQMDDQNLVSVEEVIAQTTGAAKSQRNFGAHVYTLRGYVISDTNYLLDGVSGGSYNPTGWVPVDTAVFDRVEVLRGAGALAMGVGDPSGVVNMVRKRPRAEKHFEFAQSIGSWDNYRTEIDAGGALNAAGTVRGRVVAAHTDRHYFYDIAKSQEPMFYGVVEADIASGTKATAGYRFQEQDIRGYTIFQLPMYSDGGSLRLPRSTALGQDWNRHQARVHDVFAELEHRFAGDWRGKLTLNHVQTDLVQKLNTARGAVNRATGTGTAITSNYFVDRDIEANGLDAHASGSFQALGGTHRAMFGGSWSAQEVLSRTTTQGLNIPVDVFNFNHALIPEPATPAYANQLRDRVALFGLYGSANLELAKPLHLHLGGRLSWYKSQAHDALTGAVTTNFRQNAEFTPYLGLVYDLGPQWSVYASYTSTFEPQTQYRAFQGGALSPAEGVNYEAGLKGELLDGRLNVAFSVFKIKKRNVAVVDQDHLGDCSGLGTGTTADCYRNASLLRSKGIDIEVGGQLMPGWEISSGFTVLSTRDDEGQPLTSDAPKRLLRASTSYQLPGAWSDWKLGATVNAQSSSYVAGSPSVTNPGHAVLDLRASYRINRSWTAALNVGNVFDRTYWAVIGGVRNGNAYGMPRNATLTVRASF